MLGLISKGLVQEIRVKAAMPVWRRDGESGKTCALKITAQGRKALAIEPSAPNPIAISAEKSPGAANGRAGWNALMVREDGFASNGITYASLSAVAFAITGTKWNGYRFFGLRNGWAIAQAAGGSGKATVQKDERSQVEDRAPAQRKVGSRERPHPPAAVEAVDGPAPPSLGSPP